MKSRAYQMLRTAGLILILLLAVGFTASAEDNPPASLPDLFSLAEESARSTTVDRAAQSPEVIRARPADVDFAVLLSAAKGAPRPDVAAFRLNFFEDAQFEAYITGTEIFSNGAVGLVGVVGGEDYNELVMVSQDGVLQAYLQAGDQAFEIRFTGDGHQIVEVDQSAYPDPLPPVQPPQSDEIIGPDDSVFPDVDALAAMDSGDTIDVLAVYTAAARIASGGTTGIQTKIQTSILSSNEGYANSGINQRLNLVGMTEVDYNENPANLDYTGRWYAALDRLTTGHFEGESATYLVDARASRESYGADLVFMITNITGSTGGTICGIGWVAGDASSDQYGYSVVNYNCAGNSAYTPQHEMGHNMGACHDWNNTADTIKPYCWNNYSYGYQQPNQFYTVMAYSSGCGTCTRINRWSNPNLTYNGFVTSGLVSGQSVYPNNARTLNETAYNVANWRQSVGPISGAFSTPASGQSLLYPRTHLAVSASSVEGSITSVSFYVYFDGGWNFVGTDNNGSDGWEALWSSSGVSEQMVSVKAEITDSSANTKEIIKSSVPFLVSMTTASGYQARSREGEGSDAPGELLTPVENETSEAVISVTQPDEGSAVQVHWVEKDPWTLEIHVRESWQPKFLYYKFHGNALKMVL